MTLTIPDTDHGKIRVFSVASPVDGLLEMKIEALVATFGSAPLNTDFVDVIDLDALEEMSLLDYLSEGYDVEPDEAVIAALTALEGVVVLIMSRAHEGAEITLVPADGVRHVTTLGRGARMTVAASLESEAAQGVVTDVVKSAETQQFFEMMYAQEAMRSAMFDLGPFNYPIMKQTDGVVLGDVGVAGTATNPETHSAYLELIVGCAIKSGFISDLVDPTSLLPVP